MAVVELECLGEAAATGGVVLEEDEEEGVG